MDDETRAIASQLALVIAAEMDAQVAVRRDLDEMPALIADSLLDYFDLRFKPGATAPTAETSLRQFEVSRRADTR